MTVLLVDDDPDIRGLMKLLLEAGGCAVAEACNGQAALDYLARHPLPDIVVTDLSWLRSGRWVPTARFPVPSASWRRRSANWFTSARRHPEVWPRTPAHGGAAALACGTLETRL